MIEIAVVKVLRQVEATPDDVFPFFTHSERYVQWMGRSAVLEPVPGGAYRLMMNDNFAAEGTFVEVEPSRRLVFTWGWAPGAGRKVLSGPQPDEMLPPGSSRVTVTFEPENGGTRLLLRHEGLATEELRENHRIAWTTYLERLAIRAAGGDPGPDPHG